MLYVKQFFLSSMSHRRSMAIERSYSAYFDENSCIPRPVFDFPTPEENKKRPPKLLRTKSYLHVNEKVNTLPIIDSDDRVPRITAETMKDVLNGKYKRFFDYIYIIDCRFPYEYEGGHLPGAINSNSPTKLFEKFFENPLERCLIIFHCEFSQSRGPKMAAIFRDHDRDLNMCNYPHLYYPEVYILDEGYKGFYEKYPNTCDGGYIRMHSDENIQNKNLQQCNTKFCNEIEKFKEQKRSNLSNTYIYKSKRKICPLSPNTISDRRRSCLLSSPIPIRRRPQ